jgi:hypothetical protein
MGKAPPPPDPRDDWTPDTSKPCTACRHYQTPGKWARLLLGALPACTALPVRGIALDPVRGTSSLRPPPSCEFARRNPLDLYGGGRCGPRGLYWEARNG